MTEADIVKLHEVWPEGARDVGMMLHQAPDPIIVVLARHTWHSHELFQAVHEERRARGL